MCLIYLWFVVRVVLHLSLKFKVWLIARSPCTGIIKFGEINSMRAMPLPHFLANINCQWQKSRYSNRAVTNFKMIVIGYLLLKLGINAVCACMLSHFPFTTYVIGAYMGNFLGFRNPMATYLKVSGEGRACIPRGLEA